jgi:predicted nucleotide-binding protein
MPTGVTEGSEVRVPTEDRGNQENVVFEHGYLMAKIGRKHVCALVKGDIETPNDISGVVYVPLDESGGWKMEVSKELKACGYALNYRYEIRSHNKHVGWGEE